jgi:hypothetical protein
VIVIVMMIVMMMMMIYSATRPERYSVNYPFSEVVRRPKKPFAQRYPSLTETRLYRTQTGPSAYHEESLVGVSLIRYLTVAPSRQKIGGWYPYSGLFPPELNGACYSGC